MTLMKTKLVKNIIALLVVACGLASVVAAETASKEVRKAEKNLRGLGRCR